MANVVVVAASPKITAPTKTAAAKPWKLLGLPSLQISKVGGSSTHQPLGKSLLLSLQATIAAAGVAAQPVLAKEIEKAALFDFNLTLPAIAAEFLLLMVALDKIYFTPLGQFMDGRDAAIKEKLGSVKDTSAEVKELEDQAAAVMKAARAEISGALNQMKKETTAELEQKLAEGRKKVEAELAEALQSLEKQKEDTISALDSQIAALTDEIVKKVLPT